MSDLVPFTNSPTPNTPNPRTNGVAFSLLMSSACILGAVTIFVLGILLSGAKGFFTQEPFAGEAVAEECDPPPPQRDAPPGKGERTYTVRKGDTLFTVAREWAPDLPPQEAMGALRLRNQHRLADWQRRCKKHLESSVCDSVVLAGGKLILPRRPKR